MRVTSIFEKYLAESPQTFLKHGFNEIIHETGQLNVSYSTINGKEWRRFQKQHLKFVYRSARYIQYFAAYDRYRKKLEFRIESKKRLHLLGHPSCSNFLQESYFEWSAFKLVFQTETTTRLKPMKYSYLVVQFSNSCSSLRQICASPQSTIHNSLHLFLRRFRILFCVR